MMVSISHWGMFELRGMARDINPYITHTNYIAMLKEALGDIPPHFVCWYSTENTTWSLGRAGEIVYQSG